MRYYRDHVVVGTGSRKLTTAHRSTRVVARDRLNAALDPLVDEYGDHLVLMSGGAEGWDEMIADTAIERRIRLWLALPNRGYGAHYWKRESVTGDDRHPDFLRLYRAAWRVTHVIEDVHLARGLYLKGRHANMVRNDWMVEIGHRFLVWDPTSNGTADCLASIRRAGKPYIPLSDPEPRWHE